MKGTTRQSDVTIGLDLGDRRCQACVLDAAGEVVERRSVATTKVAMEGVFDQYVGCVLVMEVGTPQLLTWVGPYVAGSTPRTA